MAAAPGTSIEIRDILSAALAKALADRKVVTWAAQNDVIMNSRTPQDTTALVARQRAFFDRWKSVLVRA